MEPCDKVVGQIKPNLIELLTNTSSDSKRDTFEKGICVGVGFRSGVACLLICASGGEEERAGPHALTSGIPLPPVEDKMVWREDILVLLLGLVIPAVVAENLKKFPILMPNVKPERVSITKKVSDVRDSYVIVY